jgi:hypothetical protein
VHSIDLVLITASSAPRAIPAPDLTPSIARDEEQGPRLEHIAALDRAERHIRRALATATVSPSEHARAQRPLPCPPGTVHAGLNTFGGAGYEGDTDLARE